MTVCNYSALLAYLTAMVIASLREGYCLARVPEEGDCDTVRIHVK